MTHESAQNIIVDKIVRVKWLEAQDAAPATVKNVFPFGNINVPARPALPRRVGSFGTTENGWFNLSDELAASLDFSLMSGAFVQIALSQGQVESIKLVESPKPPIEIEATVQRIFHRNSDTGWTAFSIGNVRFPGGAVGFFDSPITVGMRFRLCGEFGEYQGRTQLIVWALEEVSRELHEPIALALTRKGVSRDLAGLAEKEFGRDYVQKIAAGGTTLLSATPAFRRRKPATLETLVSACKQIGQLTEVERALLQAGTKDKDLPRIMRIFDERKSSYDPTVRAKLSFLKADDLARSNYFSDIETFDAKRVERVEGLIAQIVNDAVKKGHCGVACDHVEAYVRKQYDIDAHLCRNAISNLMASGFGAKIADNGAQNFLWHKGALIHEKRIAAALESLASLAGSSPTKYARQEIEEIAEVNGFAATEKQIEAIFNALHEPVSILTGAAGTGKTASLLLIGQLMGSRVAGCAFAGRAASHLQETTGIASSTIHRLLGLRGNEHNPEPDALDLEGLELLIIEEASMVPSSLLALLLETAAMAGVAVLFCGDPNQLPPVGLGEPFNDIIASDRFKLVQLDKVHRTKEGGGINLLCETVRKGAKLASHYDRVTFTNIEKTETAGVNILNAVSVFTRICSVLA